MKAADAARSEPFIWSGPAATLIFRTQLAIICLSLALLGIALMAQLRGRRTRSICLTMVVLPVFVADRLFRLVDRRLPNNSSSTFFH